MGPDHHHRRSAHLMGYYTRFDREIRIDPPLTWAEIRDSPYLPDAAYSSGVPDVKFPVEETDEGTITRRRAVGIVPLTDGQYKGYSIIETVQEVIDQYKETHSFTGRFDCEGEETGDLWRLVVRNGRVEKVEPRIVWPE